MWWDPSQRPKGCVLGSSGSLQGEELGRGGEQSQHVSAPGEGEREESEALEIANKVNDNPGAGGTQRTAAGERRLWGSGTGTRVLGKGRMGWDQQQDPNGCLSFPPWSFLSWFLGLYGARREPEGSLSPCVPLGGPAGCWRVRAPLSIPGQGAGGGLGMVQPVWAGTRGSCSLLVV